MKTIGLIGGMSWESSALYYQLINQGVQRHLGGHHSARLILFSVDFAEIEAHQQQDRWDEAGVMLAQAAGSLAAAGAEGLVICTNTMHCVAATIENAVDVPLLHIADATGNAIRRTALSRIGLLGTRFTMEQPFYRDRLEERFGLDILVPAEPDRETVHRVIYEELCHGRIDAASRRAFVDIIRRLRKAGAQGVILGCTEIGMLVGETDSPLPVFDTTRIHADAAVDFMLGKLNGED